MNFLEFLFEFFKIGAITYGGGLAMIPLLSDFSISNGWLTARDFADLIAISQSTPGPIAINLATFIGYNTFGYLGSFLASIAVVLPGLFLVIIVSKFLKHFNENPIVKATLNGLKAAVIGLLGLAIFQVGRVAFFNASEGPIHLAAIDIKSVLLFVVSYIAIKKTDFHPIVYLCTGGAIGIFLW